MSLDGFIAGPNGEYDWIVMDPDVDFAALMGRFDTFLIGRKTFEAMRRMGEAAPPSPGIRNIVFSRTLRPARLPARNDAEPRRGAGRRRSAEKDGQGHRAVRRRGIVPQPAGRRPRRRSAFHSDPGAARRGIPLLPSPAGRARLKLKTHRVYQKTGSVGLEYEILHA